MSGASSKLNGFYSMTCALLCLSLPRINYDHICIQYATLSESNANYYL